MEAIGILSQLHKYIRRHFINIPLTRAHLNMVLLNYARELFIIRQFHKAIEIAEEGQKVCLDYGHYLSLPGLLTIQAESHYFIGNDRKSRDLYRQAFYLTKVVGNEYSLQVLRENAKEYLGMEFPD